MNYTLDGVELRYSCDATPGFTHGISLADPTLRFAPARRFLKQFWLGAIGVGIPIWTFGVILLKEHRLDFGELGAVSYVHALFAIIGLVLLIAYRKPLRGFSVTIGKNDGLYIWRDSKAEAEFNEFICALRKAIPANRHVRPE